MVQTVVSLIQIGMRAGFHDSPFIKNDDVVGELVRGVSPSCPASCPPPPAPA